jgi:hypothetical protein
MQDCSAETSFNYSKDGGLVNLTVQKVGENIFMWPASNMSSGVIDETIKLVYL